MSILARLATLLGRHRQDAETVWDALPPAQWLIVGLGNPGLKYVHTRHNIGYRVVDELMRRHDERFIGVPGIPARVARTGVSEHGVLLVRPTTFMNESGQAVAPLAASYAIPADHVIVIHDELDLPAGTVRVKLGGNENGHNGLKSVTAELGTRDFVRIRVGIGRPDAGKSVVDHVLEPLQKGSLDLDALHDAVRTAADAAEIIADRGVPAAQNEIHGRR
ncbi:aminoacyl-tRNA hydrolase [Corynebacterium nuruki]|jgi:PTH1 family peptidyl-tRNA hydrolase|uniref:aminoacyl-tRNA hydrolase n=1 Tax=Corynebacterium nuruki TaxID=1032851 RepID=UPI0002485A29|nr:aminoacyl-tRNA hydrolase [Corynebacterium nuruki]